MVLKLVRTLGSLKTPKMVDVSIFGNGSKVKVCFLVTQLHKSKVKTQAQHDVKLLDLRITAAISGLQVY